MILTIYNRRTFRMTLGNVEFARMVDGLDLHNNQLNIKYIVIETHCKTYFALSPILSIIS